MADARRNAETARPTEASPVSFRRTPANCCAVGGSEAARDREVPLNDWAFVTHLKHPSRTSSVAPPSKVIRCVLSAGTNDELRRAYETK